jgi:hypothetical protein
MAIPIQIKVDLQGLDRKFGLMEKQSRFALSNSINRTLLKAQSGQQKFMGRKFVIRRAGLLKASVRMLKFSNRTTLTGTLGINPKLGFWQIHERGGIERPRQNRNIAVPMEVRRSKRGSIPKGQRPRNLKRSFVINTGSKKFIFNRTGKGKRSQIKPMYNLESQVRIRPALRFTENVRKTINGVWRREIELAVSQELKRARLK